MTIARHYSIVASTGKAANLSDALIAHVQKLSSIEGFEGGVLLRGTERPEQFIFVPRWASIDAFVAGGKAADEEAFAQLMPMLATAPTGTFLEYVPTS